MESILLVGISTNVFQIIIRADYKMIRATIAAGQAFASVCHGIQKWWTNTGLPIVRIDHPRMEIVGTNAEEWNEPQFNAFYCIPYACPPIADLRFQVGKPRTKLASQTYVEHKKVIILDAVAVLQPPQELPQNEEYVKYDARNPIKMRSTYCLQFTSGQQLMGSEDCLYLNVFTPAVSER